MVFEDQLQQTAQQSVLHGRVLAGKPGHIKLGQHPCSRRSRAYSDYRLCQGRHTKAAFSTGFCCGANEQCML